MIIYKIKDDLYIIDVADVVVVLHPADKSKDYRQLQICTYGKPHELKIDKYIIAKTKKGRPKWEVWESSSDNSPYVLKFTKFYGDKNHYGYYNFVHKKVKYCTDSDKIFTDIRVTTHGGGNWEEVWLYPVKYNLSGHTRPNPDVMEFEPTIIDVI